MKRAWIGFTATLISALSLLPTIYSSTIKKSTVSINYLYVLLGFIAQILWLTYGIINKDLPLMLLACYLLIIYIIIATSKFYFERTGQDTHSKLMKKYKALGGGINLNGHILL